MVSCILATDPVVGLEATGEGNWVPRNVVYDGVSVGMVDDMEVHPECQEVQPLSVFPVPYILALVQPALSMARP